MMKQTISKDLEIELLKIIDLLKDINQEWTSNVLKTLSNKYQKIKILIKNQF